VCVCLSVCVCLCLRVCVTHSHLAAARRVVSTYHSSTEFFGGKPRNKRGILCGSQNKLAQAIIVLLCFACILRQKFRIILYEILCLILWEEDAFQFKLFTSRGQTCAGAVWSTRLPTVSGRDSDRLKLLDNVLEVGNAITTLHKP
jgi:hypothetical protein